MYVCNAYGVSKVVSVIKFKFMLLDAEEMPSRKPISWTNIRRRRN
jgi:hypothetical protein